MALKKVLNVNQKWFIKLLYLLKHEIELSFSVFLLFLHLTVASTMFHYLTSVTEAEAAVAAGWRSALVIRPGNADLTDEHLQNFACIEQFDELYGDEDEEDIKRMHQEDNGEAEEEDEEEVDEDEEEENEEEEGEGDGDDA